MALTGSTLYLKTCVPSRLDLFFIPFLKSGSGGEGGKEQPNRLKKENHLIPFCVQLLELTRVVRHPISRKRNAFHDLAVNWVGNLLATIFNVPGTLCNGRRG